MIKKVSLYLFLLSIFLQGCRSNNVPADSVELSLSSNQSKNLFQYLLKKTTLPRDGNAFFYWLQTGTNIIAAEKSNFSKFHETTFFISDFGFSNEQISLGIESTPPTFKLEIIGRKEIIEAITNSYSKWESSFPIIRQ